MSSQRSRRPSYRNTSLRCRTSANTCDRIAARHADGALHRPACRRAGTGWSPSPRRAGDGTVASPRARAASIDGRARHELLVVGLDGHREARVRLGVFVGAVDPHVVGQRAQPLERRPELLRRALEHLAAAQREHACRRRTAPAARGRHRRCGRWCGPARRRPRPRPRRSGNGRRRRPRRRCPGCAPGRGRGPTMVQPVASLISRLPPT